MTDMKTKGLEPHHDTEGQRFVIVADESTAELTYELLACDCINFVRTYVPFRLRGKGVAEALVAAGLSWAKTQQLVIKTDCWYVEKFL